MKRISLVLLAGLVVTTFALAQVSNFNQRGKATEGLNAEGLCIAHPSLPLQSKVLVTNTVTGKEVEVTVVGRIPASLDRIADLSPGVWQELALTPATDIRIHTAPPVRARAPAPAPAAVEPAAVLAEEPEPEPVAEEPAPEPEPEPAAALAEEPAPAAEEPAPVTPDHVTVTRVESDASGHPINVTVNAYITNPGQKEGSQPLYINGSSPQSPIMRGGEYSDFLAWLMALDAREAREARESREAREARESRESRDAVTVRSQASSPQPQIIQSSPVSPRPRVSEAPSYPQAGSSPQVSAAPVYQAPTAPVYQAPAAPVYQVQPAAPAPVYQTLSVPAPQLSGDIHVLPGLPDPNSGKIYRLQVGSFASSASAARTAQQVGAAGFYVSQELYNSLYRVVVTGIPSTMVFSAIQRLGAIGFKQIWVRE